MNATHIRLINLIAAELFGKRLEPADFEGMTDLDWKQVLELSCPNNVQAIALDGIIHHLPEDLHPSKIIKIAWTAISLDIEKKYQARTLVIAKLAKLFEDNGMEMMLLKGAGLASWYPIPQHRKFSDIDFYVSDYQKADRLIAGITNDSVSNAHYHHTTCSIDGILLENHYDFIDVHTHRSSASLEKILKELVQQETKEELFIEGRRVLLPPATFNAIFLIRHASAHWAAQELGIKSICDWGVFLQHQSKEVDFELLNHILMKYNMHRFTDSINTILVEWMGLDPKYIHRYTHNKTEEQFTLAEKVINEVIAPSLPFCKPKNPHNPLSSVIFRTRRFFANKWKHDICYSDSFIGTFFQSSFSHIRKPKTIFR